MIALNLFFFFAVGGGVVVAAAAGGGGHAGLAATVKKTVCRAKISFLPLFGYSFFATTCERVQGGRTRGRTHFFRVDLLGAACTGMLPPTLP